MSRLRVKDMPPDVRAIHNSLVRARRHGIHALLLMMGVRPGSADGRILYRAIARLLREARP